MNEIESLKFLTPKQVREIAEEYGTPVFVYSQIEIEKNADEALRFPNEFGLLVRYAMKANSNSTILQILRNKGIHIDASSEYEVERAILAGYKPEEIMLTSQQFPINLKKIVERGSFYNACSLRQLEEFGKIFPNKELSIRINPGMGSGGTKKTNVGGHTSSFGIWFEYIDEVKAIQKKYNLNISKIHSHIGSGSDPEVWKSVASHTLKFAEVFEKCSIVNLGGGFKVARMSDEITTDFQKIGHPVKELFIDFYKKTGRKLKLEIEPGTHLIANSGCIITIIDDIVNTGKDGFQFIKLNTGMDTNTRPSLYSARHPLISISKSEIGKREIKNYVVVGHCCESGDLFTQENGGDPVSRKIEEAEIGDYMVMEGCGAYCSSMSTKNYNSYPEAEELLVSMSGKIIRIRKKQTLEQMIQNELDIFF
ncbi:MAG: diaminopimelate decarboxylase [Leptospiraceae bacterium]|nr:diaminopimelate decarboxylase [Leptospiraceae bacterium]MCK6381912.1 diaminopimelate decarboxylase [Leptospiraceae bacterium]